MEIRKHEMMNEQGESLERDSHYDCIPKETIDESYAKMNASLKRLLSKIKERGEYTVDLEGNKYRIPEDLWYFRGDLSFITNS